MDLPASSLRGLIAILGAIALTAGAYLLSSGLHRLWWPARAVGGLNLWNYIHHVAQLSIWFSLATILVPAVLFAVVGVIMYRSILRKSHFLLAAFAFPVVMVAAEYLISQITLAPQEGWGGANTSSAFRLFGMDLPTLGEAIDEGFPLGFEGGALEVAAGAGVPVIGICRGAFLAVEIGVNGHAVLGVELVDQAVSTGPIALGVPPERGQRRRKVCGRSVFLKHLPECLGVHA